MGLLWLCDQHYDKAYVAIESIGGKSIPSVPTVLPTATDMQVALRERRTNRLKRAANLRIDVAYTSLDARDGTVSPASPESPPGVGSPANIESGPPSPASPGSPGSSTVLSISGAFSTAGTIAISTQPARQPAIPPTVTAAQTTTSSVETQSTFTSSATAAGTSTATSTAVSTSSIKSTLSTSSLTTAVPSSTAWATTTSASRSATALPLVTTDSTRARPSTISNTASISVATGTASVTGIVQNEIASGNNTGSIGVHVILPVIMSMLVAAGLLFFFWKWLQKRRQQQKHSRQDEGLPPTLIRGQDGLFIVPGGQQAASTPPAHIPSDGSVMADLMDAVYRAEDGYRSSGVSTDSRIAINEKMQAVEDHQRRQLATDRTTPAVGSSVFGWLSSLRSAPPTVRGSIATTVPPQTPALNTAEINAPPRQPAGPWPEGFEAADPRFRPPPNVRYVSYWSESSGLQSPAKDGGHAPSVPSLPAGVSSYYAGITGSDTTSAISISASSP